MTVNVQGQTSWWLGVGLTVAVALAAGVPSARADNMDLALLQQAPAVMEHLKKRGQPTVGVLPFQVQKGQQKPSLHAGEMNVKMAQRLENMLVLLNDPARPIGILHDAARSAGQLRGATYASETGRQALLSHKYPLAWGDRSARPDLFLTGEVRLSADNRTAGVVIHAFDARSSQLTVLHTFTVKTDRSILSDCGESFRVNARSMTKRNDEELDAEAADSAATGNKGTAGGNTLIPGTDDIKFSLTYDGKAVSVETDPDNPGETRARIKARGTGTVPSPIMGNKVAVILENTSTDTTYAVVLKVNGENTLFGETDDAVNCTKWVLAPGARYEIKGFFTEEKGKNLDPFRVLSEDETRQKMDEVSGNERLGLIDVHVYRSDSRPLDQYQITQRKLSLHTPTTRGKTAARPHTLEEAQAQLREQTSTRLENGRLVADLNALKKRMTQKRLLLGKSGALEDGNALERVAFENPQEVKHTAIRYYSVGSPN